MAWRAFPAKRNRSGAGRQPPVASSPAAASRAAAVPVAGAVRSASVSTSGRSSGAIPAASSSD